jgi:hypothetical protein
MSRTLRIGISCCGAILASIGLGACGTSSTALFCVGKVPVEQATLKHWATVVAAMTPAAARSLADDSSNRMTVQQRARQFLIRAARIAGEAQEQGIRVSGADVVTTLEQMRYEQLNGAAERTSGVSALLSVLRNSAATRSDQLLVVKMSLLAEKLERSLRPSAEAEIPHARLAAYFARHKRDFVLPERRDVAVVQAFHKDTAELARREIESGRNLREVVERRNEESAVGGMKLNMTRRGLRHTYEDNYFSAKPHVLVGPLQFEIYYLFEVTAIKPLKRRSLQEVDPIIRARLISGPERKLLTAITHTLDKNWTVDEHCRAAHP